MPRVDVNRDFCNGCRNCTRVCPVNVFDMRDGKSYATRVEQCMACRLCEVECPVKAIAVNRPVPAGAGAAAPAPQPASSTTAWVPPPPAAAPPAQQPLRVPVGPAEPLRPAAFEPAPVAVPSAPRSAGGPLPGASASPAWPAPSVEPAPPPAWPAASGTAAAAPPPAMPGAVPAAPQTAPTAPAQQPASGWGYTAVATPAGGAQFPAIGVPEAPAEVTVLATAASPDGKGHKMFIAQADLCTGCRLCEMMCALKHTGVANPYRAAIKVTALPEQALFIPNICRHCANPPACQRACPVGAISTDPRTEVAVLDRAKCISCMNCVYACPFGAIPVGPKGEVYKCDLCDGDPLCVKVCPKSPEHSTPHHPYPRASCLQYVDPNDVTLMRRMVDVSRKTGA